MRILYFHYILIILFLSGCATLNNSQEVKASRVNNPLLYGLNEAIDFKNIKLGHIDGATTSALIDADNILTAVLEVDLSARNFENTLLKIDDLYNTISKVWNLLELLSSTHPSKGIRHEADKNDLRIQAYMINLSIKNYDFVF